MIFTEAQWRTKFRHAGLDDKQTDAMFELAQASYAVGVAYEMMLRSCLEIIRSSQMEKS